MNADELKTTAIDALTLAERLQTQLLRLTIDKGDREPSSWAAHVRLQRCCANGDCYLMLKRLDCDAIMQPPEMRSRRVLVDRAQA
jgi:hypothetical protein